MIKSMKFVLDWDLVPEKMDVTWMVFRHGGGESDSRKESRVNAFVLTDLT